MVVRLRQAMKRRKPTLLKPMVQGEPIFVVCFEEGQPTGRVAGVAGLYLIFYGISRTYGNGNRVSGGRIQGITQGKIFCKAHPFGFIAIQSELCHYNQEPFPHQALENPCVLGGTPVPGSVSPNQGYQATPKGNDDYP